MPEEITAWDELRAFYASAPKGVTKPLIEKIGGVIKARIEDADLGWHLEFDQRALDRLAGEKACCQALLMDLIENLLRPPKEEADTE